MDDEAEMLAQALSHAAVGGTALVVAPGEQRAKVLMRRFFELARERGKRNGYSSTGSPVRMDS